MTEFIGAFKTVGTGTVEIFLIGIVGFFAVKKCIINEDSLKILSNLVVKITFPFMIFSNVITKFNVKDYPDWWIYPLGAIALTSAGCLIGFMFGKANKLLAEKKEFSSLIGFQNASYLPLPLVAAIFPGPEAEKYFIYVFLFILGYIPLISSIGVVLVTGKKFNLTSILMSLTPPFYAITSSLLLAATGAGRYIPEIIISPLRLLGSCTIPLAMVVLGGVIYANLSKNVVLQKRVIFELITVKLLLLPFLVMAILRAFNPGREFGFLLVLESTMPAATTLVTFSKAYGGNSEFIGQSLFYQYIFSLLTIPFCIGCYIIMSG